jgi:DNA-binding IclR family transcriptional regulator
LVVLNIADEILALLSEKEKVMIEDIQDNLNISRKTVTEVMNFLVKFGFAKWDDGNRYVSLSSLFRKFLTDVD